MKRLLRPKVLIPVVLGVALIVALLAFADVKKVAAAMASFQKGYLLLFFVLMLVYEGVRGVQWHFLLGAMDIRVPLRTQIFTFAAGEVTKSMPVGNYFQNYLLQQSQGTDFGRSSAATTMIVLTEVVASLAGVVVLGIGQWTDVARPVIVIGSAAFLLGAWTYHKLRHAGQAPRWVREHAITRQAMSELRQFREGAATLLHIRVLAIQTLLGALYLVVAGAALYAVMRGLDDTHVSFGHVQAVYFFSLAFSLIVPIPVDIGVLEISGTTAFIAVGVARNTAVSAVLMNRILSIGSSLVIALVALVFLRDEFRAAIRERPDQGPSAEARPSVDVAGR